jgi:epoxyqueuosine reductase QueG
MGTRVGMWGIMNIKKNSIGDDFMSLKEEIISSIENSVLKYESKEYFRNPIVGFSSADNPLYEELKDIIGPDHLHPKDILPTARTVVSFFIPFSRHFFISKFLSTIFFQCMSFFRLSLQK